MSCDLSFQRLSSGALQIRLAGNWNASETLPPVGKVEEALGDPRPKAVVFGTENLENWDSTLLTFLLKIEQTCDDQKVEIDRSGLPQGVRQLLHLATSAPQSEDVEKHEPDDSFFYKVGAEAINFVRSVSEIFAFVGEVIISFMHLIRGIARFRYRDLMLNIQETGAQALPVVTLISVLIGLILAFVGSMQLKMFGVEIYVADLVAIGMAREMGAMMPGIIMAGRTGASFAAQLGTMTVNEEIDALRTLGISPIEFLVLPRTLAMIIMMPLLCIYSNFLGIMGGAVVGISMFDLTPVQYFHETALSVTLTDFSIGIIKSAIFGVLVAASGCMRGMQCGRSSAAVGTATTSAVVTGIVSIIIADSVVTIITSVMGI